MNTFLIRALVLTLEKFAMKKTLIALATLAAATGTAFAQSTVTIYGKLDQGFSRAIGADKFSLAQASGSRLGFRGTEDLGGGLKANFQIEHRFTPNNGVSNPAATFWQGRSIVGISGGFGQIDLGRDYTAAFWTMLGGDVFGWDGVAANHTATAAGPWGAAGAPVRFGNGITYTSPSIAGLTLRANAQVKGTAAKAGTSFQLAYANGPLSASLASEKTAAEHKYTGIGAAYNFGAARVNALIAKSETAAGVEGDSMVLGLTVPMGALTLKASYATLEVADVKTIQQLGLGARYALSKRTDLYTSFANNSKAAAGTKKNGMEFGIQHNF
jgi:predicted porin